MNGITKEDGLAWLELPDSKVVTLRIETAGCLFLREDLPSGDVPSIIADNCAQNVPFDPVK